jgi:inhibitor of cysteine peptidase
MSTISVTNEANGTSIEGRVEDEIVVRLSENPSTGYRWQLDHIEGPVEFVNDSYEPHLSVQLGSGGTRQFSFRAQAQGAARLALKHWKRFEGEGSVIERFALDLRITG